MDNRTSGHIIKSGNTVLNFDTNPILNKILDMLYTHPGKIFRVDDFDIDVSINTYNQYTNYLIKEYSDIYRIYKGLSSVGIAYLPDATKIDSDSMLSKLYELKQYTDNMSKTIHDAIQAEIGSR